MKITLTPTEFIDFFQAQLLKQDLIFSSIFFNKILLNQNEIYLSAAGWDFFSMIPTAFWTYNVYLNYGSTINNILVLFYFIKTRSPSHGTWLTLFFLYIRMKD